MLTGLLRALRTARMVRQRQKQMLGLVERVARLNKPMVFDLASAGEGLDGLQDKGAFQIIRFGANLKPDELVDVLHEQPAMDRDVVLNVILDGDAFALMEKLQASRLLERFSLIAVRWNCLWAGLENEAQYLSRKADIEIALWEKGLDYVELI